MVLDIDISNLCFIVQFLIPVVKKDGRFGEGQYYNDSCTFWIRDPNNILGGVDKSNAWVKLDRIPGHPQFVVMEKGLMITEGC